MRSNTFVSNPRVIVLSTLVICAVLIAPGEVQAHRLARGWHHAWSHNRWGYVGLIQGGWGLGGIADAPWVGGSIFGVSSYGRYPYGLYPWDVR
jgi:hypothetical protein